MADTIYYTLLVVKRLLNITHTKDDTLLDELGATATQHTDDLFDPFVETVPFSGAGITEMVKTITNYDVVADYKRVFRELEASKSWREEKDKLIETVMKQLKSGPLRSKWVGVTKDYLSSPLQDE